MRLFLLPQTYPNFSSLRPKFIFPEYTILLCPFTGTKPTHLRGENMYFAKKRGRRTSKERPRIKI